MSKKIDGIISDIKEQYLENDNNIPWIIGYSGGKDSTAVLTFVWRALLQIRQEYGQDSLKRPVFVVNNDTLVENPIITDYVAEVLDYIRSAAIEQELPIKVQVTTPLLEDSFWISFLGKGYPVPNNAFRWCTERLKIKPTSQFILDKVDALGEAIVLIGTRKSESATRARTIERHEIKGKRLTKHPLNPNTYNYAPIKDLDIEEVWYVLSHEPSPWGYDNNKLFSIYADARADDYECPTVITDKSQPACGQSRFGCWVCTVVSEDKSMRGFIESGEENLKSLHDFRNYIKVLREDSKARADYGRNGRAVYKVGALGPFLSHIRLEILHKLLQTEQEFIKNGGSEIITDSQILAIQNEWDTDFDFNKSAIRIAQKFHRLQEIGMQETGFIKAKVLHKEILEEVANKELDSKTLESFIAKAIEIYNNANTKGTNNVYQQITQEIQKLLSDKTAKSSIATMEA